MKKILISILAFIYLTSIIGITLQQHYCMNKLVSCSFFQQDKDICDNCGMENDGEFNGCCKEVKLKVKNDNDQFKSFVSILFEKIELHHHRGFYTCAPEVKIIFSVRKFADNGPPGLITIPLFILNKVILV